MRNGKVAEGGEFAMGGEGVPLVLGGGGVLL